MVLAVQSAYLLVLSSCVLHPTDSRPNGLLPEQQYLYAVLVDAGSTGTRVQAEKFYIKGEQIELDDEFYKETEPGLSEYADRPEEGAAKVAALVNQVLDFVPPSARSTTPLLLKATAGLRLLPKEKSKLLLDKVYKAFSETPFKLPSNAVSIIDGSHEGIYGWMTVNFLLGRLYSSPSEMVAALDLGGASTQLTYPVKPSEVNKLPADDIHQLTILKNKVDLYTHSYLGMGLNGARKTIFSADSPKESTTLTSPCFNSANNGSSFNYSSTTYTVKGLQECEGSGRKRCVDKCISQVKQFITSNITKPIGLHDNGAVAFSAFYWIPQDAHLFDEPSGGNLTVRDINNVVEFNCENANPKFPFLCADLIYMATLLTEGYGYDEDTNIQFVRNVNNHTVSWTLGAALDVLNHKSLKTDWEQDLSSSGQDSYVDRCLIFGLLICLRL